ncbi:MAG: methyl-accepting chemotaxis protein, partial [Desulfarculaceae bacterium]
NTQQLIEGNIKNIQDGSGLVATTDEAFSKVQESSTKVAELVGEIAAASQEQAQGVDQINQAALDMDKVTQQVASSAEESAAASEELSSQAETMNGMVSALAALVYGSNGHESQNAAGMQQLATPKRHLLPLPANKVKKAGKAEANKAEANNLVRPQDALPLDEKDDSDFKDF